MTHTNVTHLSHACQQAQEWIKALAARSPFEVEDQAYSYARAVLHALRDRLTVEEAVHLGSQLPLLIRGIYYDGWKPSRVPDKIKSLNEFYQRVEEGFPGLPTASTIDPVFATNAVLRFLEERIDPGEIRHVRGQLPRELQQLFGEEAA
jgi:uncharacterized protein (DUF2267 family)